MQFISSQASLGVSPPAGDVGESDDEEESEAGHTAADDSFAFDPAGRKHNDTHNEANAECRITVESPSRTIFNNA